MSKAPRRRDPMTQYDQFMSGSKNARTPRGVLLLAGGIIGNTILWLTGLISVARIGAVLAFFLVAAVTVGILQRVAPTLEFAIMLLVGGIIGLILVAIGVMLLKLVLHRDAKRLGEKPIFGVLDEDARTRDKQNYRRKSGR
ncbi:MAG: hypothetical protein GC179_13230 [Anaerolineaceae bacterium]|nr:hypothetical protein [Anaerolineaceae bacterium]